MARIKEMEDNIEICLECGMLFDPRRGCKTCELFKSRIQ